MSAADQDKPEIESRDSITDARGRRVTQLDPAALHLLHRHDVIEAEALGAIVQQIGPGVSRWHKGFFWTCFCLGISGLVIALVRAFVFNYGLDAVGRVLWAVNAACLCVGLIALWRRSRRGRFARVQRIMLEHHRCPHCGYDLLGLPASADDGATVCPECGCAWVIDRPSDRAAAVSPHRPASADD